MKSVTNDKSPSENILKLRELADKITREEAKEDYKIIVKKLKAVVDEGKDEIEKSNNPQAKIKCYENMCSTIAAILTSVKLI